MNTEADKGAQIQWDWQSLKSLSPKNWAGTHLAETGPTMSYLPFVFGLGWKKQKKQIQFCCRREKCDQLLLNLVSSALINSHMYCGSVLVVFCFNVFTLHTTIVFPLLICPLPHLIIMYQIFKYYHVKSILDANIYEYDVYCMYQQWNIFKIKLFVSVSSVWATHVLLLSLIQTQTEQRQTSSF